VSLSALIRFLGLEQCRRHILRIYAGVSLPGLRAALRDARRRNTSRSVPIPVKWMKCFRETGSCVAKPLGGSTLPLEQHADFLLTLIAEQPDLTLDEVVSTMRRHKVRGSRTAV